MNVAVVLAGGSGTRTNYAVPKQFLTINDVPVIIHTLMNLQKVPCIDAIIVMLPQGWERFVQTYAAQYEITKLCGVYVGGGSRHQTITKAIECLKTMTVEDDKIILLEANRPLIPKHVIENCVEALELTPAVLAVDPCYDSMYVSEDGAIVNRSVDRSILYKGQMPEAAKMETFIEIYNRANDDGLEQTPTELFLHYGVSVQQIKGSPLSFKITTAEDMEILRLILINQSGK